MFDWLKKKLRTDVQIFFRGSRPRQATEFGFLRDAGFALRDAEATPPQRWRMHIEHPTLGHGELFPFDDTDGLDDVVLDWTPGLTPTEKDEIKPCRTRVGLSMPGGHGHLLRDQKNALRIVRAVMGDEGVAAMIFQSKLIWPRAALDFELSHDADVDVEALYCTHAVGSEGSGEVNWLHTHGLAEIGGFDFDILDPDAELLGRRADGVRAIAFAIIGGDIKPDTARFTLCSPPGDVRLVPVHEFAAQADPALQRRIGFGDEDHRANRSIVCEPAGGLLSRLSKRPKPSRFLSEQQGDGGMWNFTTAATNLMRERARNTFPLLRALHTEFAEFELTVVAKLGFRVDGGGPEEREHIWFEVHDLDDDVIDGTCANQPYHVSSLQQGERGRHPAELLTDWMMLSPVGPVTPRSTFAARWMRENLDRVRVLYQEMKAQGQG